MQKINHIVKNKVTLANYSTIELKREYSQLMEQLKRSREASESARVSEVKMQMIYIIEELKTRVEESAEEKNG